MGAHGPGPRQHSLQGAQFFQMQRAVSETIGSIVAMIATSSVSQDMDRSAISTGIRALDEMAQNPQQLSLTDTLAVVEDIGWTLIDVGYTSATICIL